MSLLASASRHLNIDREAATSGDRARRTGRSWWALRYTDGHIIREWDHDSGSPTGHMDWPRLAMLGRLRGVQALRLYCPNGKMVEVGGDGDQTGRLFQFKVAVRHIVLGGPHDGAQSQEALAHVIGIVTGYDGQCLLYAWEPLPEPAPPPGAPPMPKKPAYFNREQPTWALQEQHERYVAEQRAWEAFMTSDAMRAWKKALEGWQTSAKGRLVGPIQDNVYELEYQQVGRLKADHLGIADGEGR